GDFVDELGQQRVKAARSVGAAAAVEQRDRVGVERGGERDQVVYVDRSAAVLDLGDDVDRQRAPGVLEAGGESGLGDMGGGAEFADLLGDAAADGSGLGMRLRHDDDSSRRLDESSNGGEDRS